MVGAGGGGGDGGTVFVSVYFALMTIIQTTWLL